MCEMLCLSSEFVFSAPYLSFWKKYYEEPLSTKLYREYNTAS